MQLYPTSLVLPSDYPSPPHCFDCFTKTTQSLLPLFQIKLTSFSTTLNQFAEKSIFLYGVNNSHLVAMNDRLKHLGCVCLLNEKLIISGPNNLLLNLLNLLFLCVPEFALHLIIFVLLKFISKN